MSRPAGAGSPGFWQAAAVGLLVAGCAAARPKNPPPPVATPTVQPAAETPSRAVHAATEQLVDSQRRPNAAHIAELGRLELCGMGVCATMAELSAQMRAHRKLTALLTACRRLDAERSVYGVHSLRRERGQASGSGEDPVRARAVDCRLMLDGERIIKVQAVTMATWLARLGAEPATAAERYAKQGWVSRGLAARMAHVQHERTAIAARLVPHLRACGAHLAHEELFVGLAEAVTNYRAAVQQGLDEPPPEPAVADRLFSRVVRNLYAASAAHRPASGDRIAAVRVHHSGWQARVDGRGQVMRRSRSAEVIVKLGDDPLCTHRRVIVYQHLRGPRRTRRPRLFVTEDVRFSRCP